MGGCFGAISKKDVVLDVFFGADYHSHLGTRRGGLAFYDTERGFQRQIHNIENTPFRTKFESDLGKFCGCSGIGAISDTDPQPLLVRSHLGLYAIATVGIIHNEDQLVDTYFSDHGHQFMAMSSGKVNQTELIAALINQKDSFVEGIRHAQDAIDGTATIVIMTPECLIAARDKLGRLPLQVGRNEDGFCLSFESFTYHKLGYEDYRELGPGEIVIMTADGVKTLVAPGNVKKVCAFLWVYYGYPSSSYEGLSVEKMRYRCGCLMAKRDAGKVENVDMVAAIPDSGIAYAVNYSYEARLPYGRPFVKYTPTWPRSFMPPTQKKRELIAKMKLIPIHDLIEDKNLLLIDDSIVRGTQLRETTEFLYNSGAREVHIRPACPPILFGCKYLSSSRSKTEMELITRKVIQEIEGVEPTREIVEQYVDPDGEKYQLMLKKIGEKLHFTSLQYNRLDDMVEATGLPKEQLCTYCWDGVE